MVLTGRPEKIYAIGDRGAALLAERNGTVPVKSKWRDKNRSVKRRHIKHTLRVGDVKDAVDRLPRYNPSVKIIGAADILAAAPSATVRDPKPWLWQAHVRIKDGNLRRTKAVPDAVFGLDLTDSRKRFYFFVEADRGTEPIVRTKHTSSSVVRKFEAYMAGLRAGLHQSRYGIGNLRILTCTTSQQRIETMLAALADIAGEADTSMFFFADWNQIINAEHLLAVPWRNGRGDLVPLLD